MLRRKELVAHVHQLLLKRDVKAEVDVRELANEIVTDVTRLVLDGGKKDGTQA